MGFLRFTLHLIDFLAWPVLALGYPLCASIRAIETGSKYHMKKLVTYWTIFSFISLFEHIFEKLIEWVPLWPYIKLITICWLVIPQFNSACYLYQILIRPCFPVKWHDISQFNSSCYVYLRLLCLCLSVNLQTVTDWFNKPMEDLSLKNETFLAVAERYLEENGSDALEKLIANKPKDYSLNHHAKETKPTDTSDEAGRLTLNQTECEGSGAVWEDITVMEHMAKHEAAEPKQAKPDMIFSGAKRKAITPTEEVADKPSLSSALVKNVKESSCALCQVSTTNQGGLNDHFQGKKHKHKEAALREQKDDKNCSIGLFPKKPKFIQLEERPCDDLISEKKSEEGSSGPNDNDPPSLLIDDTADNRTDEKQDNREFKFWCEICKIGTFSEKVMETHKIGKKHARHLQQLTGKDKAVLITNDEQRF